MIRAFVYTTLVLAGLFVVQEKLILQKDIQRQEFRFLLRDTEARIRINNVDLKILDKRIDQLTKDLGVYNNELNPYQ